MISKIVFVFDPNEGLRGYLKLPKDGKVKKGWRKVYAVVKDYKIWVYEKEKDVDGGEGSMVIDIRYGFDFVFFSFSHADV